MALTNSASTPKETFENAYQWSGHPTKDNAEKWALELENAVLAVQTPVATASGRGPSPLIWGSLDWNDLSTNPENGFAYYDDFLGPIDVTTGDGYILTTVNSGAISALQTVAGGALFVDSAGNNAADDGIEVQLPSCMVLPAAGTTIAYEARVQMNDTDTAISQFYIGLAGIDTSLMAAGEIDDVISKAAFYHQGDTTTDKLSVINSKTSVQEISADKATVADDTWVKLGIVIDGVTSVKYYVDGVLVDTHSTANAIPAAVMCPSFVAKTEGATKDAELTVDWIRIAQVNA
jgi:hypothetical protein